MARYGTTTQHITCDGLPISLTQALHSLTPNDGIMPADPKRYQITSVTN